MTRGKPYFDRVVKCQNALFCSLFILFSFISPGTAPAFNISLIKPETLHVEQTSWKILDTRPKKLFENGRIPGAKSFDWNEYTRIDEKKIPFRVLPPARMAAALSKLGIDENSDIVVYGDADKSWGSEGWACWVLSWLGHKGKLRLLAGGISAWKAQSYNLEKVGHARLPLQAEYKHDLKPEVIAVKNELKIEPSNYYIVDTRSYRERLIRRIPGSVHIKWTKFFKEKNRVPLNPGETKELLAKHKIGTDKPVVYYCTGGVRSGYAWLVHQLSKMGPAKNYEGGMEDWAHKNTAVSNKHVKQN